MQRHPGALQPYESCWDRSHQSGWRSSTGPGRSAPCGRWLWRQLVGGGRRFHQARPPVTCRRTGSWALNCRKEELRETKEETQSTVLIATTLLYLK